MPKRIAFSGYQLSNDNYKIVIDVLKRRFGNQQLIIDAVCHTFPLQQITLENSITAMTLLSVICGVWKQLVRILTIVILLP